MIQERYDLTTAAAWILGHARNTGIPVLPEGLRGRTAGECSQEELTRIVEAGQSVGLKLYPFKQSTQVLARTRRTLGFLHSVSFETLLDIKTPTLIQFNDSTAAYLQTG